VNYFHNELLTMPNPNSHPPNSYTEGKKSLTFVLKHKNAENFRILASFCVETPDVHIGSVNVLSPDKAVDIIITDVPDNLRGRIAKALIGKKLAADFCLQNTEARKKKLLICDMDSTLIGQECIDELADFAGVKHHVSEITERAMRGELNFEEALIERVGLLKGLPLQALSDCFNQRITLNSGAKTLATTMKANGAKTVIVSGGFRYFTSRIAKIAGFDVHRANTLHDNGEALLGTVGMPILGRDAKKQAMEEHSISFGGPSTAVAIGDGANDLDMITASGLGIAYRAKPIVADVAHCAINHTSLTTALYFQGYKESDFVYASGSKE
jgi:phosphoserine phosphatase